MESAIKIAGLIIAALPRELSSEGTEGMQGFVHPVDIAGHVETATIDFIIRDFEEELLVQAMPMQFRRHNRRGIEEVSLIATYTLDVKPQYRNMKNVLAQHPQIVDYGMEAIRRAGMEPKLCSIRGGTDGSRLSFMGLPTPNIFAGEHAFHGKQEWVSVQDMQKAVETILHLCGIWEEPS
jgi:tripeptide aminopeptidase